MKAQRSTSKAPATKAGPKFEAQEQGEDDALEGSKASIISKSVAMYCSKVPVVIYGQRRWPNLQMKMFVLTADH